MKIVILGYYDRGNLGDDVFKIIFRNLFDFADLEFYNTDDITILPKTDIVIVGGGDLINDYFMGKIKTLIRDFNGPVYAFGIGIPYPSLIDKGYLDIFDFIIHRNPLEHEALVKRYGDSRVFCFPDIAFLLPKYIEKTDNLLSTRLIETKRNIGFFLSRSIYKSNDPESYNLILDKLAKFIRYIASIEKGVVCKKKKYNVYLFAMNTGGNNSENDNVINRDLMTRVNMTNVNAVYEAIAPSKISDTFSRLDVAICMRYHAHVFAILNKVPILSIYTTNKVKNLRETFRLNDFGIEMPVNPNTLHPIDFDVDRAIRLFDEIVKKNTYIYQISDCFITSRPSDLNHLYGDYKDFYNMMGLDYLNNLIRNVAIMKLRVLNEKYIRYMTRFIIDCICLHYNSEYASEYIYQDVLKIKDIAKSDDTKFLTEAVLFTLFKQRFMDYNYGLEQNILSETFSITKSIDWLLKDFYKNSTFINNASKIPEFKTALFTNFKPESRILNLDYLQNNDLKGYHRSGWQYVIDNLYLFHSDKGIIVDSFVDKTYCWWSDFLHKMGYIPVRKDWVGFIHHTDNDSYSSNNVSVIFKNPLFIESLNTCRALFVLSKYMLRVVEEKLQHIKPGRIVPVFVVPHPTEIPNIKFNPRKFLNCSEKKIIQIGAWLRNTYAIYDLSVPINFKKYVLKGKAMENYYISETQFKELTDAIYKIGCKDKNNDTCRVISRNDKVCNKYIVGLTDAIINNHNSVSELDMLSDEEYDLFLSESIVFVNLIDASAVNTVIECLARNTPILINRLPAVVEYLGNNYPLYYNSLDEARDKLNFKNILKAHLYLKKRDKKFITIEHFLRHFLSIFNGI